MEKKRFRNENAEEEDRFSKLPMDVSVDILSRLPLKTISNCRWVSKTWYDFITHPRLAEIHFSRFRDAFPCALFHSRYHGTHLIDPDCLRTQRTTATAYHFHFKELKNNNAISNSWNCFEVVGTVNGMICFSPERCDYEPAPYYICNPITRDYVLLPKSPKIDVQPMGSGFGFDSLNNDYKVLRILNNPTNYGNEVEIYTLGSTIWRQIQITVPCVTWMRQQYHVLLNGCLHWTPSVMIDSQVHATILSFNMNTEKFILIPTPPFKTTTPSFELIVLGDCLCVVDGNFSHRKDIWVMKKYGVHSSWVKEYVFEKYFYAWSGFHEVLELENNQLLLLNEKGVPSYYNCKKKTSKQIKLHDLKRKPVQPEKWGPIYLRGSLFSPKAIEDGQLGRGVAKTRSM